jgi:NTP pyrophosphatase (non-canonical NTP hydrolase)
MSIIHITYAEASKHFATPIFHTNAGYFCSYGPCHQCSTDNIGECQDGLFISSKEMAATKQGPSKPFFGKDSDGFKVSSLVFNEIKAAQEKHPGWPTDIVHSVAIMMEEAGEAMQAALDVFYKDGDREQLKKELAQTGAMAMRCLLHLV